MRANTLLLLGGLAAAVGLYLYSRTDSGGAALASVTDALGNLLTPRGIRNNNPGNIVRNPGIAWQGSIPPDQVQAVLGVPYDPTYEQNATPGGGVRMIGHVLLSKQARGLASVDQIIRDYSTTDQDAYVANVAAALGVDPNQTIDVGANLPALATAIIQQENGEQPYDPADINQWVYS